MRLFWNYTKDGNPIEILEKCVENDKIEILEIPEALGKNLIKKKVTTLEEMKNNINIKNDSESVIFKFTPKKISKIDLVILDKKLLNIFFNINSEYEFSYYSEKLKDDELNKLINFLKDEKIKLYESLINVIKMFNENEKYFKKMIKKYNKKDRLKEKSFYKDIFLKLNDINKYKKKVFKLSEKYIKEMKEEFKKICINSKTKIEKSYEIDKFIIYYDLKQYSLTKNFLLTLFEDCLNLNDEKLDEKINEDIRYIWIINQNSEMVPYLKGEFIDDFTEDNIYDKLSEYKDKVSIYTNFLKKRLKQKGLEESFYKEEKISVKMEKNFFLDELDSNILKKYFKFFLFCSRPNEFIDKEDIEENLEIYKELKNNDFERVSIDYYKIMFYYKIKDLILVFEEKIKELILLKNEFSPWIKEIIKEKEISLLENTYYQINKKYADNIIKKISDIENSGIELYFYLEQIADYYVKKMFKEIDSIYEEIAKKRLVNIDKNLLKDKEIKQNKKEDLKMKNTNLKKVEYLYSRKDEFFREKTRKSLKEKNKIDLSFLESKDYLNGIKYFTFSNLKRVSVYYKILILNLLSNLDVKDIEKYLKEKDYEIKSYEKYFYFLKSNRKNLVGKHLEYIYSYLKEKNSEKAEELITYVNYYTLYSENLWLDILDLEKYEEKFISYQNILSPFFWTLQFN